MQTHFSTDDLPLVDREPTWLKVVRQQMFSVTPSDQPDPGTFRAQLHAQLAGRFTLVEVRTTHRTLRRTTADIASDNAVGGMDKFYLFRAAERSVARFSPSRHATEELLLSPGDLVVGSVEWPFEIAVPDGVAFLTLLIPKRVLSPLLVGGRLIGPLGVPANSPLGSMLGTNIDAAGMQLSRLSPDFGDAVLASLCSLVALACSVSQYEQLNGRDSLRVERFAAVKRHIERNLADPDLTPTTAARALSISVRQLHLLFEPSGTSFAQHVLRRRLHACRTELESRAGTRRSVADIAFGWGFNSMSTFYRAFVSEFGATPDVLRAAAANRPD
jgi:AraC-like DNA-binding protein